MKTRQLLSYFPSWCTCVSTYNFSKLVRSCLLCYLNKLCHVGSGMLSVVVLSTFFVSFRSCTLFSISNVPSKCFWHIRSVSYFGRVSLVKDNFRFFFIHDSSFELIFCTDFDSIDIEIKGIEIEIGRNWDICKTG